MYIHFYNSYVPPYNNIHNEKRPRILCRTEPKNRISRVYVFILVTCKLVTCTPYIHMCVCMYISYIHTYGVHIISYIYHTYINLKNLLVLPRTQSSSSYIICRKERRAKQKARIHTYIQIHMVVTKMKYSFIQSTIHMKVMDGVFTRAFFGLGGGRNGQFFFLNFPKKYVCTLHVCTCTCTYLLKGSKQANKAKREMKSQVSN